MAELVRFYWHDGEVTLPLGAIPEGDRNPLRLRRSVVRAHAPVVIAQLEAGRFIATAWSSGGGLCMILCHPSLAKGDADTVLLSSLSLPRLNVKLGSWEEAPALARLLLSAFGSEAATPADCMVARRDLVAWLVSRAQPEMAAVTRHFSAFPFGVKSDALEVINIWRKVLVKDERAAIDNFLGFAEKFFSSQGWTRDTQFEERCARDQHQLARLFCWLGDRGPTPQVMLCLNRVTDTRVRGSTYNVLDHRAGLADVANAIQHVLGEVLEPAAEAAGLKVTYPHLGPISRVGEKTSEAMATLAEACDGQWPLPEQQAEKRLDRVPIPIFQVS